jgi:hypothetical protein
MSCAHIVVRETWKRVRFLSRGGGAGGECGFKEQEVSRGRFKGANYERIYIVVYVS